MHVCHCWQRVCDECHRPITGRRRYVAMQIFSFHPLCALRFIDRTPEQDHSIGFVES